MKTLTIVISLTMCISLQARKIYYITDWGVIGGRTGGWEMTPGQYTGDVSISGSKPLTDWAAVRGGFTEPLTLTMDSSLIISGIIKIDNGGFNGSGDFRFGLLNSDSAGVVIDSNADSIHWSGSEGYHTGYLFLPPGGWNSPVFWPGIDKYGSVGAVVDDIWWSTEGENDFVISSQLPSTGHALPVAGQYNFAIIVALNPDTTYDIRFYLLSIDNSYAWFNNTTDVPMPRATEKFNCVAFAIGAGNPVTALHLEAVKVDFGPHYFPPIYNVPYYIDDWGFFGGKPAGWELIPGDRSGDVSITGNTPLDSWAAVRGGFKEPLKPGFYNDALVITGKLEFVGAGFETWSAFRFGVFRNDSAGVLIKDPGLDSNLVWSGSDNHSYGYLLIPPGGRNEPVSWSSGTGNLGLIINGRWISTYTGNNMVLGNIAQQPARAMATAGIYDFAVSVQPHYDGTSEICFMLAKEDGNYWYTGSSRYMSDPGETASYNGVCFGLNPDNSNIRRLTISEVKVAIGKPFSPPEVCFCGYGYVDEWGFLGGRNGGWHLNSDEISGNVNISGTAPLSGWTAVSGNFSPIVPREDRVMVIKGAMELEGGGFEAATSLRFGVFFNNSVGELIPDPALDSSSVWTGPEDNFSGYLFIPPGGTEDPLTWGASGEQGNWGGVLNANWFRTDGDSNYMLGNAMQYPAGSIGGAGKYDFAISISALNDSTSEVRFKMIRDDSSYGFAGSAFDHSVLLRPEGFNCINIALNTGNSTAALNITNVYVDLASEPIDLPEWVTSAGRPPVDPPGRFALYQNYPNPFNPVTQIEYAVPFRSQLSVKVYNMLGQVVANLFEGVQKAGLYKIRFDGSDLPTGAYFYRLRTGDVNLTRKFILLR